MSFSATDFMVSADALGVAGAETFLVCPDMLGKQLMAAAKRHARFLEAEFPLIGHRKMLEIVANAAGFPNWHAFQTLLDRIVAEYAPPERGSRKQPPETCFQPLVPALPLLISLPPDIAPTPQERAGLSDLATRLSRELGGQHQVESALAKLNGADAWRDMLARKPEDSPAPLYQFHVYDDGDGRFVCSPACASLVEELDDRWQRYDERPKSDQAREQSHVASILKKRPDFLEGWLAQATMQELERHDETAGLAFRQGVDRALALIPTGFKGEISWGYFGNRTYHRLLYNYMRWHVRQGDIAAAIKLARRQLRQNPNDNLGVRFDLPLFLSIAKERSAALRAMAKIQKKGERADGHILLILALCSFLLGDSKSGQVYFLRALFDLPALRPLLQTLQLPDDFWQSRRWHRGYIPDIETLWFHYEAARIWRQDMDFDWQLQVMLEDPEVIHSEREVHARYEKSLYEGAALANTTAELLVERNGFTWDAKAC